MKDKYGPIFNGFLVLFIGFVLIFTSIVFSLGVLKLISLALGITGMMIVGGILLISIFAIALIWQRVSK